MCVTARAVLSIRRPRQKSRELFNAVCVVCLHICACGDQKREPKPLELESHTALSHHVGAKL